MDIATVAGIIGGFVLLLSALFLAGSHGSGVSLGQFIDPPAAILARSSALEGNFRVELVQFIKVTCATSRRPARTAGGRRVGGRL